MRENRGRVEGASEGHYYAAMTSEIRPENGTMPKRAAVFWGVGLAVLWGTPAPVLFGQGTGPTRVEVGEVKREILAPTTRLVGTIRPTVRTVVAAEVGGLVAEMQADDGKAVTKGQVLCRLRDVRQRLAHAEALAKLKEYEGAVAERAAEMKKAEFEKARTERLWAAQQCSEKEYHDAQAEADAAASRFEQAKAQVEAQKAVTDALADDLARMEIQSPCDGFIVAKRTEIGSWVEKGGAIAELVDVSTARVRVPVPEAAIAFCELGATATVSVEALNKSYSGRIARIIADGDERARTFPVEIDIPNPKGELKPGMFVRAAIPSGPKAEQFVVPKDAVVPRGPVSMIFVVRDGPEGQMASPAPVVIVAEVMDHVAVSAPMLQGGERVVVRGNEYMFAPGPVIVASRDGAAAAERTSAAGSSPASQASASTRPATSRPAAANRPAGNTPEAVE